MFPMNSVVGIFFKKFRFAIVSGQGCDCETEISNVKTEA